MEVYKITKGDLTILNVDDLDINNDLSDQIYLKDIVSKLFSIGDQVYFFFRNEEYFREKDERKSIRAEIFDYFDRFGKLVFLTKLDEKRFDAIGMIDFDLNTSDFILKLWKYFSSCDFFKPINDLTFDEYQDYLECNGVYDEDGLKMLWNKLCNFICIKGIGGDYLILSYNSLELSLEDYV